MFLVHNIYFRVFERKQRRVACGAIAFVDADRFLPFVFGADDKTKPRSPFFSTSPLASKRSNARSITLNGYARNVLEHATASTMPELRRVFTQSSTCASTSPSSNVGAAAAFGCDRFTTTSCDMGTMASSAAVLSPTGVEGDSSSREEVCDDPGLLFCPLSVS